MKSIHEHIPVDHGVSIYTRSTSASWYIQICKAGKRLRECLYTRRKDLALLIAQRRAEQVLALRHGVPLARDPLFGDLLKDYKEYVALRNRDATRRLNLDNLRRITAYLQARIPKPRPLRASDFHPEALEAYMKDRLEKGISPATINRERCTLASLFRRASRRGLIRMNPMTLVDRLPEVRRRLPTTLSGDQVDALLKEARKPVPFHGRGAKGAGNSRPRWTPLYDLILTALNTGARLGELLYLEWEDVDWSSGRLKIVNKDEHLLKDREDRVIACNGLLLGMLRRRQKEGGKLRWVFPSQAGEPFDRRNLLREFKRVAERAGVPWANFLILRHTALTALARSGAPMLVLREVAGHESSRTTERYYIGALGGDSWRLPEMGRSMADQDALS